MSTILPRIEVAGPPVLPSPFGLFTIAPMETQPDERWTAGVWWRSVLCGGLGATENPCTVDSEVDAKMANAYCTVNESSVAFTVYARSDESMGGAPLAEKFAAARAALLAGEQSVVERQMWALLGSLAGFSPPGADAVEAIAFAEANLRADYPGQAIIHVNPATVMLGSDAIYRSGQTLETLTGARVIAGSGYTPGGVGPGIEMDVYASGPVVMFRGPVVDLGQHVERETNTVQAVVERSYVIGVDCLVVGSSYTIPEPAP